MKNLFKNPKTRLRNLLLVILPFVVLICAFGAMSYSSIKAIAANTSGTSTVAYKDSIDSMDYHLRDNATDLQEELFHELSDAIKDGTDQSKIALLVCENFVADFYTWTNKVATYDVGGMYYVYSPQRTTIYQQARNTYYKYLTWYIDNYGQENLLEVESFVDGDNTYVSSTPEKLEVNGTTYDSYYVSLEWTYKNLDTFSSIPTPTSADTETGFETRLYFQVIINEEGRYEIANCWGGF